MVFLRATRYYFLLTNHSIHTIKGTEQNLINGLFENLETLDITGGSDFFDLFPLFSKIIVCPILPLFQAILVLF